MIYCKKDKVETNKIMCGLKDSVDCRPNASIGKTPPLIFAPVDLQGNTEHLFLDSNYGLMEHQNWTNEGSKIAHKNLVFKSYHMSRIRPLGRKISRIANDQFFATNEIWGTF